MMIRMEQATRGSESREALGKLVQKRQAMWKQLNAASTRTADLIDKLDKPSAEKRQRLQNKIDAANKKCDAALKRLK